MVGYNSFLRCSKCKAMIAYRKAKSKSNLFEKTEAWVTYNQLRNNHQQQLKLAEVELITVNEVKP